MNPDKNEDEKLPDGWMLCQSKSNPGRKYYFNKKTGKSSWTQPQVDEKADAAEHNKQKSKKEKCSQEKSKKEEQRKILKRKSDNKEDSFSKKKQKQEPPTPQKRKPEPNKIESPLKCPLSKKADTSIKPTPSKNLANTRLSQLRAQLDSEILNNPDEESPKKCPIPNKKDTPIKPTPSKISANTSVSQLRTPFNSEHSNKPEEESPLKNKTKISPKSQHNEAKIPKTDLKSPNFSESKCSTTHSPGSDSLQSIPSPSQFFAANKIISSMKAQLPEEYSNKTKPKDTFADIEEGICNQTAEYPFMKHPATPPQFSEASKLVSAMKSRLSYKVATKDVNVKQFTSAKDRMESLRMSLGSNESLNASNVIENNFLIRKELPKFNEAMEVEDCKEMNQSVPVVNCNKDQVGGSENVVLVVDTNIFIHELDVIKDVLNSHIKGYSEQPTLLVPWRVINELDRLKDNNNGTGAICKRARAAMDYLYKSLPENSRIRGQSLRDSNSHIYPCELPDDEILNCCLQQAERGKSVILLSNDKNLCNKALVNRVKCIGLEQLRPLLENKPQPADPELFAGAKRYEDAMYHLLANILENEMRAKYNNLWQHVLFKAPPWTLSDVLQCLLKHWVAVFSEVFPRIEHLFAELRACLRSIESKGPKSLSQSEVSNFKELCLEIAKKCQIIPEYMQLAKATVERLVRECASEHSGREEMALIDAFEGLWTVFSSYCAKLCTAVGVPHAIEDKLPLACAEPLAALASKLPAFRAQLAALGDAMQGTLNSDAADPSLDARLARLENAFGASLALVGAERGAVSRRSVAGFWANCRNMLHEAHAKFSELSELLTTCDARLAST